MTLFFCSSCLSEGERAAKLLKITWVIFPFGVVATIAACLVIFCSQALSYSDPCAKAILIYGNLCSSSNFLHAVIKLRAFSVFEGCLLVIVLPVASGCSLYRVYLKHGKRLSSLPYNKYCGQLFLSKDQLYLIVIVTIIVGIIVVDDVNIFSKRVGE